MSIQTKQNIPARVIFWAFGICKPFSMYRGSAIIAMSDNMLSTHQYSTILVWRLITDGIRQCSGLNRLDTLPHAAKTPPKHAQKVKNVKTVTAHHAFKKFWDTPNIIR